MRCVDQPLQTAAANRRQAPLNRREAPSTAVKRCEALRSAASSVPGSPQPPLNPCLARKESQPPTAVSPPSERLNAPERLNPEPPNA